METKGRFAPSPTGRMHLGNVFSALLSWLSAKEKGGKWLLRIEDIDPQRSRQEYADMIMDDLEWLGLEWDEGPYYQSQRSEVYQEYLDKLRSMGVVYPCYCTRADILATQAPHESDGRVVYKGTCRKHATGYHDLEDESINGSAALRLMVPPYAEHTPAMDPQLLHAIKETEYMHDGHYGDQHVDLASQCGDFIIRRKDGAWAYQLAVVVDDALMGITEVVRGRDLLLSSPQQNYVATLLGFTPPQYYHLPLLCNKAGQRLSKRDKSLDMECLRSAHTAEEIIGLLAGTAGITNDCSPIKAKDLIPLFSWNKIPVEDITSPLAP